MSREQWVSVGKGGLIALGGFVAAWLSTEIIPKIDSSNTGGMLAVAVLSFVINFLRKATTPK